MFICCVHTTYTIPPSIQGPLSKEAFHARFSEVLNENLHYSVMHYTFHWLPPGLPVLSVLLYLAVSVFPLGFGPGSGIWLIHTLPLFNPGGDFSVHTPLIHNT